MKLSEINQDALDAVCAAQPIDLATLHCLRSIAVSLEILAGFAGAATLKAAPQGGKDKAAAYVGAAINLTRDHSVGE